MLSSAETLFYPCEDDDDDEDDSDVEEGIISHLYNLKISRMVIGL